MTRPDDRIRVPISVPGIVKCRGVTKQIPTCGNGTPRSNLRMNQ